jgi:hypothetical protein
MIAALSRSGVSDDAIAKMWLSECLRGNFPFFKLMLQYCEDNRPDALPEPTIVPAPPETSIDSDTITRMLEAADPSMLPNIDEEDAARPISDLRPPWT